MARKKGMGTDPLTQGKGRSDEVDQSKGIFPPGVPHPADAEIRPPGSLGGGPYDESGRGGVSTSIGQSGSSLNAVPTGQQAGGEAPREEQTAENEEPKGALPPHDESKR